MPPAGDAGKSCVPFPNYLEPREQKIRRSRARLLLIEFFGWLDGVALKFERSQIMKRVLLILAATLGLVLGGLLPMNSAGAQVAIRAGYGGPVAVGVGRGYYGYRGYARPYYGGYYGYRPYYRSYYQSYYPYAYHAGYPGYSYGYPRYYSSYSYGYPRYYNSYRYARPYYGPRAGVYVY
jgi:hypothetical protein